MYVIGISAYYHDSSVCLFSNGRLVYACEEEKFTGIKHDSRFPKNALNYILEKYKIKRHQIESVCYYEDPNLKWDRVKSNFKKNFFNSPTVSLKSLFKTKINYWNLKRELSKISDKVFFSKHHESHIFYSYYSSPFNNCMVLSIDGVGEWDTASVAFVDENDFKILKASDYPNSIGLFYSAMTSFIGFKPNEGEYKMMGLAPYGNPEPFREKINQLINYRTSTFFKTNMEYFTWDRGRLMFNHKLIKFLGVENRLPEDILSQQHKDIAASVQEKYETILFQILNDYNVFTSTQNLALGGGCAYNGTANGKILDKTNFKKLWIPPAPSDAGSCIGACLKYFHTEKRPTKIHVNPFIGPEYGLKDIENTIKKTKGITFKKYETNYTLNKKIAEELEYGRVVGMFKGSIEFGARALGHRSILANPTHLYMKEKINSVIKRRELFRPFAPMVTFEDQKKFFDYEEFVPYMNQVVKVKKGYRGKLPAVTHIDGTARIQSVNPHNTMYPLLKEFESLTGYPILLNTSFNVKDKTMVLTPQDAMNTFMDTDIDILVLDNYIIRKS